MLKYLVLLLVGISFSNEFCKMQSRYERAYLDCYLIPWGEESYKQCVLKASELYVQADQQINEKIKNPFKEIKNHQITHGKDSAYFQIKDKIEKSQSELRECNKGLGGWICIDGPIWKFKCETGLNASGCEKLSWKHKPAYFQSCSEQAKEGEVHNTK